MSTWDEIKNSPVGTEFTDKDGDRWQFTETEVVSLSGPFYSQGREDGSADLVFGGGYYGPYTIVQTPLPEHRYIEAALAIQNLAITAEQISAVLDLARKIEEAAK